MCFRTCVKSGSEQLKDLKSPSFHDESSPGQERERLMSSTASRQVSNKLSKKPLWLAQLSRPVGHLVSVLLASEERSDSAGIS